MRIELIQSGWMDSVPVSISVGWVGETKRSSDTCGRVRSPRKVPSTCVYAVEKRDALMYALQLNPKSTTDAKELQLPEFLRSKPIRWWEGGLRLSDFGDFWPETKLMCEIGRNAGDRKLVCSFCVNEKRCKNLEAYFENNLKLKLVS